MKRNSIYCCLLAFLGAFNLTHGSLHRIQYRGERVDRKVKAFARCAKQVTRALFDPSNRILLVLSANSTRINDDGLMNDYIKILSNDYSADNTVTIVNEIGFRLHVSNHNWQRKNRISSYVIIENELENLRNILLMKIIPNWSEYLIVTRLNEESLKNLSISLWQNDFVKIAFLHINNEDKFGVLRTVVKSSKNVDSSEPEMKRLLVCGENNFKVNTTIQPFSSILCPAKGCYVSVGHVKNDMVGSPSVAESRRAFDAADHVVRIFLERYNIELINRSTDEHNWTETLNLVHRDEIDLLYGSFIPRTEGLETLDIASWFGFETVMFVDMSLFQHRAPLSKIFFPLDTNVWICLIMSIVLISILAFFIEKAYEKKLIAETVTYFHMWAILLGQGVKNPRKIGLRMVIGMWMITSLLINAAYLCAFKSSLASFARIETLKTIDDINNSGRRIAGTQVARELFHNFDNEADRKVYERWQIVHSDEVFPVVIQEHIVGVDYVLNVKIHNFLYRKRFQPSLYTLKDPILVYPLNFYLKKGHPYVKHFRKLVVQIRASGLVEKWNVDDLNDIEQQANRRHIRRGLRRRGRLKMKQIKVALKLWFSGNFIASIVFFYELYKGALPGEKVGSPTSKRISCETGKFFVTLCIRLASGPAKK